MTDDSSENLDFPTYLGVIEERDLRSYRAGAVWETRYRQTKAELDAYVAHFGPLPTEPTAPKEASK